MFDHFRAAPFFRPLLGGFDLCVHVTEFVTEFVTQASLNVTTTTSERFAMIYPGAGVSEPHE